MEKAKVKYTLTHSEAFRKARHMAEVARPAITDHEFWNNDYTDDMIAIIRDPSFMSKPTFFAAALTDEDRDFCEQYLLRAREIDIEDRAARERLRSAA
ncbi:hypothetical protein SJ05684_c10230 [Sinorhizobium sojae CCBAU 05684]|uniref:Phage protein n=1 Tax=Sinorhizobium sojae CCBAU 05684 TaxID=716928 RepID=A0A249P980_9HYPH|nr:hypothetical protein [Sinorhizobium sojae]ASY62481.1 hypothetical protein SJ05684_c10230 [Sinorhizobium sojae CCBAU 05684]